MATKYSDQEIANLVQEQKILTGDFWKQLKLRQKRGHKERELEVKGISGNRFRLIFRESYFNLLDFFHHLGVMSSW